MKHQALARQWRPQKFSSLVGQAHVVRALSQSFAGGRVHHAYLLTGTRGVGKTTIARILAKAFNCLHLDEHAEPCGACSACTQIESGRFVDVLELDAASNTGIDNMREVLESAHYSPTVGQFKVFIIDEVHMLSKSAFNAMLKTLEEPPAHVKFILATTDPQKVPVTVLSRCLQFNLRGLTAEQVAEHLAKILNAEAVVFEPESLLLLGRAARGSMRDALSLLDQAIALGAGVVTQQSVRHMLGLAGSETLAAWLDALARQEAAGLHALVWETDGLVQTPESLLDELASVFQALAWEQVFPGSGRHDLSLHPQWLDWVQTWSPEVLQLFYQIVLHGRRDLALAPEGRVGLSMVALRLLAFAPDTNKPAPPPPAVASPRSASAPKLEALTSVPAGAAPLSPEPDAEMLESSPPVAVDGADWPALVRTLGLSGGKAGMLARVATLVRSARGVFELSVPPQQKHLAQPNLVAGLQQVLGEKLGYAVKLTVQVSTESGMGDSLAARENRSRQAAMALAQDAFAQDVFVQDLQREAGASVIEIECNDKQE